MEGFVGMGGRKKGRGKRGQGNEGLGDAGGSLFIGDDGPRLVSREVLEQHGVLGSLVVFSVGFISR